jgi:hypothetical protein
MKVPLGQSGGADMDGCTSDHAILDFWLLFYQEKVTNNNYHVTDHI